MRFDSGTTARLGTTVLSRTHVIVLKYHEIVLVSHKVMIPLWANRAGLPTLQLLKLQACSF